MPDAVSSGGVALECPVRFAHPCAKRVVGEVRIGFPEGVGQPQALCMIGDDEEIQWSPDANRHAVTCCDGLSPGELIGHLRGHDVVAEQVGVAGGKTGMHMSVAPQNLEWIVPIGRWRIGVCSEAVRAAGEQ